MTLKEVLVIAILIESATQIFKMIITDDKVNVYIILSIGIGILACIGFGINLFASFGLEDNIPFLGNILTGLIIARGSNAVHDILNKIEG